MSNLIAVRRGTLARLILPAVALALALAPGIATASVGSPVASGSGVDAKLDKGSVTCTPGYSGIGAGYTSTPIGIPGSPLMSLTGEWATDIWGIQCASSSAGQPLPSGAMSISGDYTAVAAGALGCPLDLVSETLTVRHGWISLGREDVTNLSMTWTMDGHQFVITGNGVDQRGNDVTISGYATFAGMNPGDCESWMIQTYGYLTLNATW